jgi:hypothetical protein
MGGRRASCLHAGTQGVINDDGGVVRYRLGLGQEGGQGQDSMLALAEDVEASAFDSGRQVRLVLRATLVRSTREPWIEVL